LTLTARHGVQLAVQAQSKLQIFVDRLTMGLRLHVRPFALQSRGRDAIAAVHWSNLVTPGAVIKLASDPDTWRIQMRTFTLARRTRWQTRAGSVNSQTGHMHHVRQTLCGITTHRGFLHVSLTAFTFLSELLRRLLALPARL
jgi:hypothetical protein